MPNDHFALVAASSEHVYALTSSGVLYFLPRSDIQSKSPGWSIWPMSTRVSKIVSVHNWRRPGLDCLALLIDGTLWRLDSDGDTRMSTFSSVKPEYQLVDDVFPFLHGYSVLRYKRFAVECVPYT
jgi:hypothetical protein